ncbi:MAG TPA: response regulator [Gammaproteobacteria bacterium]|nr:response regulator [Gammaproteobacteria bacterium]
MAEDNPKKVVLVVDDAPANIQVLSAILKQQYKVKAATSGEKALKIASSDNPPDIILLDILMPEMDGFEVCRQLKASGATRAIPVVFVTGADTAEDKEKGLALGAVDFLTKPVDPDQVHTCISQVLS